MLEGLLQTYGYWAILLGTFFEGETILVLGAFAAHRGYLSLPWVIAAAFAGSLAGDQLYFFIGRRHGQRFLERRPRWVEKTAKVREKLERHNTLFILSFRFLYGLRTVSSFAVGMTEVSALRYAVLNTIGAATWAVGLGLAGYLLGEVLALFLDHLKEYELYFFVTIAVAGLVAWVVGLVRGRRA